MEDRPRAGERAVIWTLWLTYGAFYFCRTNISAAVPGLKAPLTEGGLALSGDQVGWILASLKIAYGLGQLLNGQLSERFSPRAMLALGMFGSAALNVTFGFSAGAYFLLFVWASNGFCQSLGWTPTVRVVANWVPTLRRGNAIGIIGTGYQITLGLTYVIAGQSAEYLGWRAALWAPAILLAATGLFMLVCLRERPDQTPADTERKTAARLAAAPAVSFADSLYLTLYNPALWLMGLSLGLLNACRYGFLDWGVAHLMESQKVRVGKAALQYFVIAIGATAGSYVAGWVSDRFFGSRRAPVVCILMALLGSLCLIYDAVARQSPMGTVALLIIIGFCIYGPQVMLVGTAPADLAHRGTSAAAAGFVNFMGYMGAASGDVITGYYSSAQHGGWQTAIYIWAAWAFAGAVTMALLWNTTTRKITLMSESAAKIGAITALAAAGAAITWGGETLALRIATWAALAGLLGAFAFRWAALPALLVAAIGLFTVFGSYLKMHDGVTASQSSAMVLFGLAMIACLMALMHQKDKA